MKFWRENCCQIVLYIDDGIGTAGTYDICKRTAVFVKASLKQAGFVINIEKSHWEPTKQATWLRVEIDTEECTLKIPEKRI